MYTGQTKDGLRHGVGTYNFPNKTFTYTGQWENGLMHGRGTFKAFNLHTVTGNFENNEIHGHASKLYQNGNEYEGKFKNGEPHGQGLFKNPSTGETYQGLFVTGNRHGKGLLTNKSGTYEGSFESNVRSGFGTFTSSGTQQIIYSGEWKRDLKSGRGKLVYSSGASLEGQWENDLPNGDCKFVQCAEAPETGYVYQGSFVDGTPTNAGLNMSLLPARAEADNVEDETGNVEDETDEGTKEGAESDLSTTITLRCSDSESFPVEDGVLEPLALSVSHKTHAAKESGRSITFFLNFTESCANEVAATPSKSSASNARKDTPTGKKDVGPKTLARKEQPRASTPPPEANLGTVLTNDGTTMVNLRIPMDSPEGSFHLIARDSTDLNDLAAQYGIRVHKIPEVQLPIIVKYEFSQ